MMTEEQIKNYLSALDQAPLDVADQLASSGKVDLYTLQKLLRHSTPVMTQRYAHLRDEALKSGAGAADDIFSDKEESRRERKWT
jgi:integrase